MSNSNISVNQLQHEIMSDKEKIRKILESLGISHLKYIPSSKGGYFQFPRIGGDNPTGCVLYEKNLYYECFTRPEKGNIWTLIMKVKDLSFKYALSYACQVLELDENDPNLRMGSGSKVLPFGGFYKKIKKNNSSYGGEESLKVYPESILDPYVGVSYNFFLDNIDYKTQERFGVAMDLENNAIVIPIRSSKGDLVGVKCRNNNMSSPRRYWALYRYSKSKVVYGISENYTSIAAHKKVIIVEAEKSVMQAASFNCNLCVAISGHSISDEQVKLIHMLMCSQIIVAFDEGVDEDDCMDACEKLTMRNEMYVPKIGYVYDYYNEILEEGKKESPTDIGREGFTKLLTKHVQWI